MTTPRTISFDGWVLRTDLAELTREGRKIRLQDQPLQILEELLSRPGELVTRDQLIARLWPKGVVDFDTGLNSAVRKLRMALNDVADTPRYIETVPRRGYRFVGVIDQPPTTPDTAPTPDPSGTESVPAEPEPVSATAPSPGTGRRSSHIYAAALAAVVLVAGGLWFALQGESGKKVPTAQPAVPAAAPTIAVLPFDTSRDDEGSVAFASSLTRLVHESLGESSDITVISSGDPQRIAGLDLRDAGAKLGTAFVVQGKAARTGDELRVDIALADTASGKALWSTTYSRPATEISALLRQIRERVRSALRLKATDPPGSAAPIQLDAYALYARGMRLMESLRLPDAEMALELCRRATILDPAFARGYLGLGQAQFLIANLGQSESAPAKAEAEKSLDRALELDPALGEAWIERARLTTDPKRAEEMYRKGIALAPNYGTGYLRFAEFLFDQYRKGEMMVMIDRAAQLEPRSLRVLKRKALFVMVARSDPAEHDRLMMQALDIDPKSATVLVQLAVSSWEYTGKFAEAIRLIEKAISMDPEQALPRQAAALMYLDVDDLQATLSILRDADAEPDVLTRIALYRGEMHRAAELARSQSEWYGCGFDCAEAGIVLAEAIETDNYEPALRMIESRYSMAHSGPGLRMWNSGLGLTYAQALLLSGQTQRARKLATSIMVQIDSESEGRVVPDWFARQRAAAFAILGDQDRALEELAKEIKLQRTAGWWQVGRDPVFASLRDNARFQSLLKMAADQRAEQRVLVDQMRQRGEIPGRR